MGERSKAGLGGGSTARAVGVAVRRRPATLLVRFMRSLAGRHLGPGLPCSRFGYNSEAWVSCVKWEFLGGLLINLCLVDVQSYQRVETNDTKDILTVYTVCRLPKPNAECTFRFPLVGLGLMGTECFSLEVRFSVLLNLGSRSNDECECWTHFRTSVMIVVCVRYMISAMLECSWNQQGKDPVAGLLDCISIFAEPLRDDRTVTSPRSERLAAHHDPSSTPWWLDEAWEGMNPEEWEEVTYELITTSCTAYWDGGITGVDNVQLI
uniref:Uncharacterized protein n=1 Tax=Physcomitrium patens TaxID=3218 RepID=A0A2K1J3A7_PHYPA|nr:hypothetical protein PHYPA_021858 [Physcomitrium patens]